MSLRRIQAIVLHGLEGHERVGKETCCLETQSRFQSTCCRHGRHVWNLAPASFTSDCYTLPSLFKQLLESPKIRQIHKYLFIVLTKYYRGLLTLASKHFHFSNWTLEKASVKYDRSLDCSTCEPCWYLPVPKMLCLHLPEKPSLDSSNNWTLGQHCFLGF